MSAPCTNVKKLFFILFVLPTLLSAQLFIMKQIVFVPEGSDALFTPCGDTDHDSLNEIIFSRYDPPIQRMLWGILEEYSTNKYQLVFTDTGSVYPYPPGITTGNFEPWDIGDIDRDSLTDLVGPNYERANDSTYNIVTTQESPNYSSYPENLSWWSRYSYNEVQSAPFYFPPDLDSDNLNELLFLAEGIGVTHIFENRGNNQNQLVWSRYQVGAWSFAFDDFDLDGRKEFATANLGSLGKVSVYENTGPDQYEMSYQDTVNIPNGHDVFSGNDVDSDGHPEFFIRFAWVGWTFYLYMWEATGNNTYQRTLIDQVARPRFDPGDMRSKCGDIDGDSIEEIVWSIASDVFVYKATGNNQFQVVWHWINPNPGPSPGVPGALINIYDVNRNGYNEIVISGWNETKIFELEAIRLLRPNGGETFQADSQQRIRWLKFYPPRCDSLSLFYSIDNGINYTMITHGISGNDTSYLWTVPNANSDSCKIKIIAYGRGWQYDESDGVFRITTTGIEENQSREIKQLSLKIFPSLFKSQSSISLSLPEQQKVILKLYNISGKLIRTLCNEEKKQGIYKISLNSKDLPLGVYFLALQTSNKKLIERFVIVK